MPPQYLKTYGLTARELAVKIIRDVLETTGITATAGIGTNLYLCKIRHGLSWQNILRLTGTAYHRGAGRDELPAHAVVTPSSDWTSGG